MDRKSLRKLISRLLRHSGFEVKMNKSTHEYEFFKDLEQPILYCKQVIEEPETEGGDEEVYLCFHVLESLSVEHNKIYERMIARFNRLAPQININFENWSEPIFTDEQEEKLVELLNEYDNKGDENNEEQSSESNTSL